MSIQNFIPQLWADSILAALRAQLVYGNLVNRDYEGQLKGMGDTVKINAIGDITISSYVKDTDINTPQALTDAQSMLVISQAKYFNFAIDDIDQAQQHPKVMGEATSWAGYKIALTIDQFIAGLYTDASASNLVGSSGSPTTPQSQTQANVGAGNGVYDYLVTLGQYLTQSLVPKAGRWCVVPVWVKTMLLQDIRFTSFNTPNANSRIEGGDIDGGAGSGGGAMEAHLGQIDGMDIYESVNAPHLGGTWGVSGSQDVVIAGHPMAITYADGFNATEAYRPPYRFADALKGLALYGARVIRPYALAVAYLQHP